MNNGTPKILCREVTGADCDRVVDLFAHDCGIPEHVLPTPAERSAPGPTSVFAGPNKPRLTVNEDFDVVSDIPDDGEFPAIHPETLFVSRKAQEVFTTHHEVLPKVAIEEIRLAAGEALARGSVSLSENGFVTLRVKSFQLTVSPDGQNVIKYTTQHFERMPSEVFAKLPSRFGAGQLKRRTHGEPIATQDLRGIFQPESVFVTGIALNQYAKWRGLDKHDEDTLAAFRVDLAHACRGGVWTPGRDKPGHIITFRNRDWIISADGIALVLCVPSKNKDTQ